MIIGILVLDAFVEEVGSSIPYRVPPVVNWPEVIDIPVVARVAVVARPVVLTRPVVTRNPVVNRLPLVIFNVVTETAGDVVT